MKRYNPRIRTMLNEIGYWPNTDAAMEEDKGGEWVKYEDVKKERTDTILNYTIDGILRRLDNLEKLLT